MQLPVGVYVICPAFEGQTGEVCFRFQGKDYTGQLGENAFCWLEDLIQSPLKSASAPFLGYWGTPILLFPAGIYDAASPRPDVPRSAQYCTYLPQAVTVLGENAGIDPNGPDKRTPNPSWGEDSVFLGSYYFGALGLKGVLSGTLTIDGMTFQTSKIVDDRTGGDDVKLVVNNCVFRDYLTYDLIQMEPFADKNATRQVFLQNIRCDGLKAYEGESRLIDLQCGDLTVEGLYFGNTDKFPGLTDFLRRKGCGRPGEKATISYRDCLFENCTAPAGLGICAPEGSEITVRMEKCTFQKVAPAGTSPLFVHLATKDCRLELTDCAFLDEDTCPAVCLSGPGKENVQLTGCVCTGFAALCGTVLPRSSKPLPPDAFVLDDPHAVINSDFAGLDALYADTKAYHGDAHAHSDSGGTSDGATPLGEFVQQLKALDLDFAAIVDHRQMRHFFLPQWDETMLICGSEPSARLIGKPSFELSSLHYCMLFPDKEGLGKTLEAFPEFQYTGGTEGTFTYPRFTQERFRELGEYIYSIGGLLSHAHPKQGMVSDDPLDYYVSDHVALETVHGDVSGYASRTNRLLWLKLLQRGCRVRTYGSTDTHAKASAVGQTTLYAKNRHSRDFFDAIRSGNCSAGAVGIQMAIGNTPMGGVCPYQNGLALEIRVDDFHKTWKEDAVYRLQVFTDKGLAYAAEFVGATPQKLSLSVEKRAFYRVEITNETNGSLACLGNPIWLD